MLGVLLSAAAQLLIKYGVTGVEGQTGPLLRAALRWPLLAGAGCYLVAFALYIYILSVLDVSFASPVMVGGVTLLILLGGYFFGEPVGLIRVAGAALIVAGIVLISFSVE